MSVVLCPNCHEKVALPEQLAGVVRVRCPLCQEEYPLEEALAALPPRLIVVEGPGRIATGLMAPSRLGGAEAGVEIELPTGDRSTAIPAFQLEPGQPGRTIARSAAAHRPQRSALGELIKIVAGGVVGLVIGQFILWWAAGRDPFDLGPAVSQVAPWIVPAQYRAQRAGPAAFPIGSNLTTDSAAADTEPDPATVDFNFPLRVQAASDTRVPEKAEREANPEPPTAGEKSQAAESAAPDAPDRDISRGESTPAPKSLARPSTFDREAETPLAEDVALPALVSQSSSPSHVRVAGLPLLTATDLEHRLQLAHEAKMRWDHRDRKDVAEIRKSAAQLYQSLASLGEVLTAVDSTDSRVSASCKAVHQLLEDVADDPDKAKLIRKVAPSWMSHPRPHDGVIVIGQVQSVYERGPYLETIVRMGPEQEVSVISVREAGASLEPGRQFVLLGLILSDPAEKLTDYTGSAASIILDGCHLVTPDLP